MWPQQMPPQQYPPQQPYPPQQQMMPPPPPGPPPPGAMAPGMAHQQMMAPRMPGMMPPPPPGPPPPGAMAPRPPMGGYAPPPPPGYYPPPQQMMGGWPRPPMPPMMGYGPPRPPMGAGPPPPPYDGPLPPDLQPLPRSVGVVIFQRIGVGFTPQLLETLKALPEPAALGCVTEIAQCVLNRGGHIDNRPVYFEAVVRKHTGGELAAPPSQALVVPHKPNADGLSVLQEVAPAPPIRIADDGPDDDGADDDGDGDVLAQQLALVTQQQSRSLIAVSYADPNRISKNFAAGEIWSVSKDGRDLVLDKKGKKKLWKKLKREVIYRDGPEEIEAKRRKAELKAADEFRASEEYKLRVARDFEELVPALIAKAAELGATPGDPDADIPRDPDVDAPSRQDMFMAKVHAAQELMQQSAGAPPSLKPPPLAGDAAALGRAAAKALAATKPDGVLFAAPDKAAAPPAKEPSKRRSPSASSDSSDDRRRRKHHRSDRKKRKHRYYSDDSDSDRGGRRRRR